MPIRLAAALALAALVALVPAAAGQEAATGCLGSGRRSRAPMGTTRSPDGRP